MSNNKHNILQTRFAIYSSGIAFPEPASCNASELKSVSTSATALVLLLQRHNRTTISEPSSGGSRISERGGQSTPVGGSGGMLPQKILNFRPSEVVSGAFWVENCFLRLLLASGSEPT